MQHRNEMNRWPLIRSPIISSSDESQIKKVKKNKRKKSRKNRSFVSFPDGELLEGGFKDWEMEVDKKVKDSTDHPPGTTSSYEISYEMYESASHKSCKSQRPVPRTNYFDIDKRYAKSIQSI